MVTGVYSLPDGEVMDPALVPVKRILSTFGVWVWDWTLHVWLAGESLGMGQRARAGTRRFHGVRGQLLCLLPIGPSFPPSRVHGEISPSVATPFPSSPLCL